MIDREQIDKAAIDCLTIFHGKPINHDLLRSVEVAMIKETGAEIATAKEFKGELHCRITMPGGLFRYYILDAVA